MHQFLLHLIVDLYHKEKLGKVISVIEDRTWTVTRLSC